jgi:hypothetical protein
MAKIYLENRSEIYLLIGLENQILPITEDINEADIILLAARTSDLPTLKPNQVLVMCDLYCGKENGHMIYRHLAGNFIKCSPHSRCLILSQYQYWQQEPALPPNVHLLQYDIMFNRTKAYFSQLPFLNHFTNTEISWLWAGNRCYDSEQWSRKSQYRSKIFIACNRDYNRVASIRPKLTRLLETYHDKGYVSGNTPHDCSQKSASLYSHRDDPTSNGALTFDVDTGSVIDRTGNFTMIGDRTLGYAPVHQNYYEDSFISIFGETLEWGNAVVVSEKTFTPLIQGHFILPFGARHTVATIEKLGFQLPDFIDYSYDQVASDNDRQRRYLEEVERLLGFPNQWWESRRNENLDLLFYNKRLFWTKPLDQFLPSVNRILSDNI